jgi:clan AA aspartic protease
LEAWIDTAFTGHLMLPARVVADLNLARGPDIPGKLADGSRALLHTHLCQIEWFGKSYVTRVPASPKEFPLIGLNLLEGLILTIDYPARTLTLTPSPSA